MRERMVVSGGIPGERMVSHGGTPWENHHQPWTSSPLTPPYL